MNARESNDRGKGLFRATLIAAGIGMALGASPVYAVDFTVNDFTDAVDDTPGDGICEVTLGAGDCTLRAAIMETNDLAGADTITLPAGVFELTLAGVDERCENPLYYPGGDPDFACTGSGTAGDPYLPVITADPRIGDLDILDDVTITGAGADQTLIHWGAAVVAPPTGDTDPLTGDRIFHVQVPAGATANIETVVIRDLAVANGEVGLIATAASAEGGDLVVPDDVNAYDIEVVDTTAGSVSIWQFRRMGGAIALGAGYSVVLYEETAHGPSGAPIGGGGGGGGGSEEGGPFPGGKPGEEEAFGITNVTLERVVVVNNWAGADGGGIYSAVPATINQSGITGNTSGGNGGGIYNDAELQITNSGIGRLFDAASLLANPELGFPNRGENGGGLFDTGSHVTTLAGVAINGNEAIGGGGIAGRAGITINIDNSTVSGNVGTDVGGGITTNGTVTLRNVTVANNQATTDAPGGGAGLNSFGSGTFNIINTVLMDNEVTGRATPLSNCGCTGGAAACPPGRMVTGGNNLENGDSCDFDVGALMDQVNADALLEALADNGGWTETHALLAGSPAIDRGSDIICNDLVADYGNVDQRGVALYPRRADGNGDGVVVCDVGAFERVAIAPAPAPAPGGGGGGGGGCALNPHSGFDPVLPGMLAALLGYLGWRRRATRS